MELVRVGVGTVFLPLGDGSLPVLVVRRGVQGVVLVTGRALLLCRLGRLRRLLRGSLLSLLGRGLLRLEKLLDGVLCQRLAV